MASQIHDGMERLFDPDKVYSASWTVTSTYGSGDCGEVQHELNYPHFILLHFEGSEASWNFFLSRRQDPNESHGRQGVL